MPQSGIVKYHVKLSFKVDGLVERTDIIGAVFGQTEGLLGPEMNLNELQRLSKIGRIEVHTSSTSDTTSGTSLLPMSTDIDTCALIAAAVESIDKVGPFDCTFRLDTIEDVRAAKKDDIVKRAKEIKQRWSTKTVSEGDTMLKDVHEGNAGKVESYGRFKLPCGSGALDSQWLILVEGRADIINLLRAGYNNTLAIQGATIDESIKDLCIEKEKVVAFLDGDRAGGFILKELKSVVHIDVELRADEGVEVEELTPQRIDEILRPVSDKLNGTNGVKLDSDADKMLSTVGTAVYSKINETLEAVALDDSEKEIFKVPISELVEKLNSQSGITYLILDGIITQRLVDSAKSIEIKYIIGKRIAKLIRPVEGVVYKTFAELGIS
ncbi:MAG: DNA primase DnaG [Candidatus Nitrosoabyssus spongiisocia]|nr:MAG: DNA primase DnaG [Nitrosopumilaceae archaeon AB1(1)]